MNNEFNINEQYGSGASYIKASDLQNRRVAVTINSVTLEPSYDKTKKVIVLGFDGKDKKFTLNATNARMISDLFKQPDASQWIGKTISLRPDKTTNPQGVIVDCIKVDFELPEQVGLQNPLPTAQVAHQQPMMPEIATGDIPF